MNRLLLLSLSALFISACSNVPKTIQSAPPGNTQLQDVVLNTTAKSDEIVRWGGEIIEVENNNDYSIIQVVEFPLNHYGKPNPIRSSAGRFLAKTENFVDPAVYKKGDLITIAGEYQAETNSRIVDEKEVSMPVIQIIESYKWQPYQPPRQSLYYDPFFHPYSRFHYGYGYRVYPRMGFGGYRYYY